jgi:ankyrin repeat protein
MKYIKLFEAFKPHDPYELMMIPPNKKAEMIMQEVEKDEPNLNLVSDLIVLGANLDWQAGDNNGETALHFATLYGNVEISRMLIDAGADLDIQDKWCSKTPLHEAASWGRLEIVRMLIDAGAKVNLQDKWDHTPLHLAANNGSVEIAKMLIDAGADETILNDEGLRWDEVIDYDYYNDYDE